MRRQFNVASQFINYGHEWGTSTVNSTPNPYNAIQAAKDLQDIKDAGYRGVRIFMGGYTAGQPLSTTQQIALLAKSMGLITMWGTTLGDNNDAKKWANTCKIDLPAAAVWCQQNNIDYFLCGNERGLTGVTIQRFDNVTINWNQPIGLTTSALQQMLDAVQLVRDNNLAPDVKILYSASQNEMFNFSSPQAIGALDYVGVNIYQDDLGFYNLLHRFSDSIGPEHLMITEWSTTGGINSNLFNKDDKLGYHYWSENDWASALLRRKAWVQSVNPKIENYFAFGDGQAGVENNQWALQVRDVNTNALYYRKADYSMKNQLRKPVNNRKSVTRKSLITPPPIQSVSVKLNQIPSAYITIPSTSDMSFNATGQHSYIGWINLDSPAKVQQNIIDKGLNGTGGFLFYVNTSFSGLYFQERKTLSQMQFPLVPNYPNGWLHFCIRYDGSGNLMGCLVNGKQKIANYGSNFNWNSIQSDSISPTIIGNPATTSFNSNVKMFGKYNRLLRDSEVINHYLNGVMPPQGKAYWPMNENSGSVINDIIGANNGQFNTGPTTPQWSSGVHILPVRNNAI